MVMRAFRIGRWCRSIHFGGIQTGRPSVLITALPAALGELVVVVGADQGQVGDVGVAAVVPGDHMMPFAPLGCHVAAGEGAAGVAGDQREGLGGARDPAGPVQVEDRPLGALEAEGDVGLVGQESRGPGRDQSAVGVGADAVLAEEVLPGHGQEQGGRGATGRGQVLGAQGRIEHRGQRVVLALALGSLVRDHVLAARGVRSGSDSVSNLVVCGLVNGPRRAASFWPTSGVNRKSPAQEPSLRCLRWKNRRRRCSASSAGRIPSGSIASTSLAATRSRSW